jgi:anti-anti-sigma factor
MDAAANNNYIVQGFDSLTDKTLGIRLEKMDELPRCLVLHLSGSVDTYNSFLFEKRVTKAIEAGYNHLIFNGLDLERVNSAGVGTFVVFLKLLRRESGEIALVHLRPGVTEKFNILGFAPFFNIHASADGAVSFFRQRETDMARPEVFPKKIHCPACKRRNRVVRSGRFRCSYCHAIIGADEKGKIVLG